MTTRRTIIERAAALTVAPIMLANADEPLPEGVIAPYQWNDNRIPITGNAAKTIPAIDEAVTAAMRQYGIVGCGVCVIRGDAVVYSRGYGYSELPRTAYDVATATRCGSLAKPITALSALILAGLGKLDIDAPIVPILKSAGIEPKPVGAGETDPRVEKITSRHLMDHTSGFPSGSTYTAWRPGRNLIRRHSLNRVPTSADVASDALGNSRLDSEPGARFQYANANFVLLARVIEAKGGMSFNEFLTGVAMAKFGVLSSAIYVSRNQETIHSRARGHNEAAYYQTSTERYVSFLPQDQSKGKVFGEAYRGYATEASDGAGGIACTAAALGKIIANLHSDKPALSAWAMEQLLTPPDHYTRASGFDPSRSTFYSKGFNIRFSGGKPWFSHSGMTNHCGGIIGHSAGYQFVAVSNWNNTGQPYVDYILNRPLTDAIAKL